MPDDYRELYPYQVQGAQWAYEREHFGLVMEMRLGKTITYIRWNQSRPEIIFTLVVAPLTVLTAWEKELTLEGETYATLYAVEGTTAREDVLAAIIERYAGQRLWVLIHYDLLRMSPGIAWLDCWDAVVLDESTKIKNPQAQITKICLKGFRDVKHRTILTGMPSTESYLDIWSQFAFLHGTFMDCDNFWKYRSKFFEPGQSRGKWSPKFMTFEKIQHAVHERAFIKRRKDVKVGGDKIIQERLVQLSKKDQKIYDEVEANFAFGPPEDQTETQWLIVMYTWLRRLTGGFYPDLSAFHDAKFDELESIACDETGDDQIVVWFSLNEELQVAYRKLSHKGVSCGRILGETKYEDRKKIIGLFQAGKIRVLLAQGATAKYGIDCSAADLSIYFSHNFSCEQYVQSSDRPIHPEKTTPHLELHLLVKHTIDEDIYGALRFKKLGADTLVGPIWERTRQRLGLWTK
jgi:SNF2 family DNA or RNA helicase